MGMRTGESGLEVIIDQASWTRGGKQRAGLNWRHPKNKKVGLRPPGKLSAPINVEGARKDMFILYNNFLINDQEIIFLIYLSIYLSTLNPSLLNSYFLT